MLKALQKYTKALNISKVTVTGDSLGAGIAMLGMFCLLYTSDAADE